jgi:TPR repeat protein
MDGRPAQVADLERELAKQLVVRLIGAVEAQVRIVHLRRPIGNDGIEKQKNQCPALLRWAMRHLAGDPKAKDEAEALKWFRKAAKKGLADAQTAEAASPIRACPFCGGQGQVEVMSATDAKNGIGCGSCPAAVLPKLESVALAVTAWNRRKGSPAGASATCFLVGGTI